MKIGILTLHDSTNYGAVLQAYATSRVLRALGHDPILIDRRRDPTGRALKWELSTLSPARRLAWFLGATGAWHDLVRRRRTERFLHDRIGLTPYHFTDWRDAPAALGVDRILVGSDQVWNVTIHDPLDYMPGRIPAQVPAFSYAASIGMPRFPEDRVAAFREGLRAFKAISVRESTSVDALRDLGLEARLVVDPVVAAGRDTWDQLLGAAVRPSGRIFVYLLGVNPTPAVEWLNGYAAEKRVEIDFFAGRMLVEPLTSHGHPRLFKNLRYWRRCRSSGRVHIHTAEGPEEFLRAIAAADAVVTSSYHALLFSILYRRNVRFVVPEKATPQSDMMVRLRDYAGTIVQGPLLQEGLPAAFASLATGARTSVDDAALARRRDDSLAWVKGVLHD